jgi:hypothetical protein
MEIRRMVRFRFAAVAGALLAIITVILAPAVRVRAQSNANLSLNEFGTIDISGFQANSSSPFLLKGNLIGVDGAIWARLAGPSLSPTFAFIPAISGAMPAFTGAGCEAEYTQDQIVENDGSTLTVNVFGTRCEPGSSPGAHSTIGVYSIISGTGRLQGVTTGTGEVAIDAHADGSGVIHIAGPVCCPPTGTTVSRPR